MQRQKIRPSFAELQGLNKEFDQSDGSDSDDGVPEYAPAATPFRGVLPPVIASSSSSSSSNAQGNTRVNINSSSLRKSTTQPKIVRIAPSSSTQVHEIESRSRQSITAPRIAERSRRSTPSEGPESFRFTLDQKEEGETSQRSAPLIGTIQERAGLNVSTNLKPVERKVLSKFAQSKKVEKSGGVINSKSRSQEVWLDEDGEPMSAFRKSRLIEQGKGPPSKIPKSSTEEKPAQPMPPQAVSLSLDPLMQAISQENETKLSAMSVEEMEQSLQDLQDTFGVEMLEKLKRRKDGKSKIVESETASRSNHEQSNQLQIKKTELTQEEIRTMFFPSEPKDLPSSLQWIRELEEGKDEEQDDKPTLRFDFSGKLIEEDTRIDRDTHSAGLHHHGDEQHRAGYSFEELLHLARSTLPSQCAIALQTLERIFSRYNALQEAEKISVEARVIELLVKDKVRGKTAVIASWYIEDRQVSVQSAAMRCLDVCSLGDILQALSMLPKGHEKAAFNLIDVILPSKVAPTGSSHILTLAPFINEMLRTASHHKANLNDETVDPLSGIELWQSASTGLPLRPDWPFIALDDLLHSGNCASLNRKNALSTEWDATERQIVVSSLELGLQMWTKVIQDSLLCTDILPSSSEVQLAIIKVFMLEEDQTQGGKATGLITGRDLFRDDRIAKLLEGLFDLAKQLDQLPSSKEDDLEKVATRHFGSSLPFYQLYTNFLGLYDSISFGMEIFGRATLLAQSNKYASDYRRLLWIDYGHCLTSMQTTVEQSPSSDIECFLCSDVKDEGIFQAMANVLMKQSITKERNALLFHVAVQQLSHAIWYTQDDKLKRLAKALFNSESGRVEVQDAIMQYGTGGEEEMRKRREFLDNLSQPK